MTSLVMLLLLPAIFSCWHFTLVNSSPSSRMLTSSSPGLEKGKVSFVNKRAEEISPSPDYISNLWSDIEDAFRFLEEQPVERSSREKSSLDNSDRIRKQEKINKLPFTQHNFIRFGKRFTQNLDIPSSSSEISDDTASKDVNLEGVIHRLKDNSYTNQDRDASEFAYRSEFLGQDGDENLNRLDKRQLHKFVRIGKSFQDTNPLGIEHNGDEDLNLLDKRQLHKFVRIGRRFQDTNPLGIGRNGGDDLNHLDKRQLHKFVRIGKRLQDTNPLFIEENGDEDLNRLDKRQLHKFVRIGKRLQDPNPLFIEQIGGEDLNRLDKRPLHKFVRIGKRFQDRNSLHVGLFRHGARGNEDEQSGFVKRKYSNFVRIG